MNLSLKIAMAWRERCLARGEGSIAAVVSEQFADGYTAATTEIEAEIRKLKGQLDFAVQDATRLREEAEGTYELLAHFRDDRARLTAALKEISETFVLGKPHGEGQKVLHNMARKVLLADE
jgi:BMFP domain-containing protein YqiC